MGYFVVPSVVLVRNDFLVNAIRSEGLIKGIRLGETVFSILRVSTEYGDVKSIGHYLSSHSSLWVIVRLYCFCASPSLLKFFPAKLSTFNITTHYGLPDQSHLGSKLLKGHCAECSGYGKER